MPANLPPQYFEAEKQYKQASTPQEKVEALQNMLSLTPKHKGTDKLRAEIRGKIAKFDKEAREKSTTAKKEDIYYVKKEGAGQVVLVGLPNVGKSQLVSTLTGASPEVADYPFTTTFPIPGMMKFENIQIQLVDMPPLMEQESLSKLSNALKNAGSLAIVVSLVDDPAGQAEFVLEELRELRINPLRGEEPGMMPKRAVILGNKQDLNGSGKSYQELNSKYGERVPVLPISAKEGLGLEEAKKEIYKTLNLIRVYTKAPGGKPGFDEPIILETGSTVEKAAKTAHKDFCHRLKYAQVWGSGKFQGQRVKRDYILGEGDVIELHI